MPKAKPYSGPVDDKVAVQLLNSTGVSLHDRPLGDALRHARQQLEELVEAANDALEGNEFASIVAEHLANKMGRRGNASVSVSETGTVTLEISYEDAPKKKRRTRTQRSSSIPLMDDLKAKAKKLGVDISEFGIKRKKIHEYLQKVERGDVTPEKEAKESKEPDPPKKAEAKTGASSKTEPQAAEVKTANDPPEEDPGPMSAGPDETKVSPPPDDPKPPKRGFVKTGDALSSPVVVDAQPQEKKGAKPAKKQAESGKGRSMRELVDAASEVNIADLLGSDPPK
jgi:hypothetical protein